MLQQLSIRDWKDHYVNLFNKTNADESPEVFKSFLRAVLKELAWDLKVDLTLMEKDINDDVICNARSLGALESLSRVLLALAEGANYKATNHPDWSLFAGRIEIQRLKLSVPETFSEMLNENKNVWRNDSEHDYYDFANRHAEQLEALIVPERDYDLYFFGVRTLEKSYLMQLLGGGGQHLLETPQRMYLRIAAFLWMPNLENIKILYDLMSTGQFTHASPTMFHAGIAKGSLASCYLLSMQDDLEKIFKCLGQCGMISKSAGGIGLDIANIRHSKVGHLGQSSGIVPMLKMYDAAMRYVDQCFDPSTIVYCKDGPKEIGDVTAGDELVTLNGYGKVAKPMHYKYDGKQMYSLEIKNYFRPVIVAGVHPMYVIRNQMKGLNFSTIINRLNKGIVHPEFIPVENLTTDDFVGIPIPDYTNDQPIYDKDDCYMYGLMIGDGHCCRGRNEFGISLGIENKQHIINFVKSYLNINNIHYWEANRHNTLSIRWSGGASFPFNRKMMYDNNDKKIIHHSMIHLPKEKCLAIIKGLIHTDGCYKDTKEITFYNSSVGVLEAFRYMLLRFGIGISGYIKGNVGDISVLKEDRTGEFIVTKQTGYCIRIPKVKDITDLLGLESGKYSNFFIWNNIFFTRITKKECINYTKDTIVELEMVDQDEQSANYLTSIGCAHNGGRRKGSATIFLPPWHIDFPDFLVLRRQHGKEELRARDLFYSVWNCDIFMDRVRNDAEWSLFCPKYVPELKDTYGEEFEKWYLHYETELPKQPGYTNYMRKVPARKLWDELITTQTEAGMPFMTNKDTANYTSNQKNLGLIRSSNLCVEIMEVTDEHTISSCNLASIALDECVERRGGTTPFYNHTKLGQLTRLVIRSLNRVIERTFYPLQQHDEDGNITEQGPIKKTNLHHRPLGLGVQALADTFLKMGLAWTDPAAKELNREIFATMYYHAIDESVELAKDEGVYDGFYGSPASKGLLKFDLIAQERARKKLRQQRNAPDYQEQLRKLTAEFLRADLSTNYDWDTLRAKVKNYGLRNSLLIALMPTASSAQIRYKNESFEPFTTNMYVRSVLSGNHLIVNRYMVEELSKMGLWNKSIVNFIIKNEGSIANLPLEIVGDDPDKQSQLQRIKEMCQTAFELPQKLLVDMAIDRAYYVCQSQSLNIHIKSPTSRQLTSLHFYAWENCLSTGMYYLRTAPATEAVKFTVEGELDVKKSVICTDEICISCQS